MQQEAQRGCGFIALHILNLCSRWGWVVTAMTRPLYSLGKSPGTHFRGYCVGSGAGLDRFEERKFLFLPGFESHTAQAVASCYTVRVIAVVIGQLTSN
jgi:hypothetical protein